MRNLPVFLNNDELIKLSFPNNLKYYSKTYRKSSVNPERSVTFLKIALVLDSDGFLCLPYSFGPERLEVVINL